MRETIEDIRLQELEQVWEMGEARKEFFRLLAAEAAAACDRPIAMLSLVDRHYQWIKAQVNMPKMRLARSAGFCGHTMMGADLLEVDDLTLHPVFNANPLVTSGPLLRSYAGTPILSPAGFPLGALCVLGLEPGSLTEGSRQKLAELGQRVMAGLDPNRETLKRERVLPAKAAFSDILKLAAQRAFAKPEARPKFFIGSVVAGDLLCDEYAMVHELSKIFVRFAAEGAKSLSVESSAGNGLVTVAVSSEGSSPRKLHLRAYPSATAPV